MDFISQIVWFFCWSFREVPTGFLLLVIVCDEWRKGRRVLWKNQIWSGNDWDLLNTELAKPLLDLSFINIVLATSTCSPNKVSSARCHSLTLSVTYRSRPSIFQAECIFQREEDSYRLYDLDNIWQDYATIHVYSASYTLWNSLSLESQDITVTQQLFMLATKRQIMVKER